MCRIRVFSSLDSVSIIVLNRVVEYILLHNVGCVYFFFFFSSRRRHTRCSRDWSSDVCSSDLSAPFPLGRGCSLRTARSGQGRAGVARRSEPFTARTVLRSSTRGKGVALNGPLKWPSRSPPLTSNEGFERASATPNEFNARCRQGSDGSGNKFSPAVNRSVA